MYERLVRGMSTKEVALELNVTSKTVEFHCGQIFEKMNVESVVKLVLLATQHVRPLQPR
jgi:DNA-binding NarL/FixJ family response regulator